METPIESTTSAAMLSYLPRLRFSSTRQDGDRYSGKIGFWAATIVTNHLVGGGQILYLLCKANEGNGHAFGTDRLLLEYALWGGGLGFGDLIFLMPTKLFLSFDDGSNLILTEPTKCHGPDRKYHLL